ncbi:hypothetical protein VTH8203_01871 [Vibrio thalassae]|uniref:Uncharacterized protein n=1 Tax=Vibrio thalassae TaxID=1243014 RepID=A0A240EJ31_9VIBR|nr:hypothetical protein [Vibrio thalassae]SNX48253.1 hypothetical protein VTH8203_01871 [Vibrio thalassae]
MMRQIMLLILLIATSHAALAKQDNQQNGPIDDWKGNVDVTFAGWTEHLKSTGRNQDNYIVGFRYKQFEAFTLLNSFNTRSYIVSYHPQIDWKSWAKVGLRLGGNQWIYERTESHSSRRYYPRICANVNTTLQTPRL